MREQHNLLFLLTPPSLPEGACSLLQRAYPIGKTEKPVGPARDVASQFARKHMLSQSLPTEPAFYSSCAHRTTFLFALSHSHIPVMGVLPESTCSLLRRAHPNGGVVEPVSSARDAGGWFASRHMLAQALPTARTLSPHYPILIVKGVWGLCPHG